jgi:hypothetical protein
MQLGNFKLLVFGAFRAAANTWSADSNFALAFCMPAVDISAKEYRSSFALDPGTC